MHKFWGKVRKVNQRGKSLGFPTANVNLGRNITEGIYISKTRISDREYKSITFIGAAKIFNEKKVQSETYILDFNKNIYDSWISVKLLRKIRDNKKFSSVEDLIKEMKKDEEVARQYFTRKYPID